MAKIYKSDKKFRENTRFKLLECLAELNFTDDVINASIYLLNISMKDNTKDEYRETFMQNELITNKIKQIGRDLGSFDKMQHIIQGFREFHKKYPRLTNILLDLSLLNYIWDGINGWMA